MGANAQVALEKFARYFDVECRLVPISVESKYRLDPKKAMDFVDENTVGVFVILGSKFESAFVLHVVLRYLNSDFKAPTLAITSLSKRCLIYWTSMKRKRGYLYPFTVGELAHYPSMYSA